MCIGFLKSSLGKKYVMAVTGLVLLGYVIVHMLGNLQIFLGPEALNAYAHKLQSMPLVLWPFRIFLLAAFLIHLFVAIQLTIENRAARPIGYAVEDTVAASYASRTMRVSGVVILAFVIYHLLHFTFGRVHPEAFHRVDEMGRYDVYSMVVLGFRDAYVSASYIIAMAFLCLHLSHGAASLFQTLGLNDERCRGRLRAFGYATAAVIFIGNCSIPVAVLLGWVK